MNVLSLFTGIGGLDLGLDLALHDLGLPAATTVAYCERDAAAIEVLAARMEDGSLAPAPIVFDVGSLDGYILAGRVDLIVAGYPCQPDSVAGKRKGIDDERWMWDEVERLVRVVRPIFLFVENVAGHLSGGFGRVLRDLAACGFDAAWDSVSAASVGAPHIRDRVFCLAAHPERIAVWKQSRRRSGKSRARAAKPRDDGEARAATDTDGQRGQARMARARPERAGRDVALGAGASADTDGTGREAIGARSALTEPPHRPDAHRRAHPAVCEGLEVWRERRDRGTSFDFGRAPQPVIRRMDVGSTRRVDAQQIDRDRLFVLGNAVVPQAAARAFVLLYHRLMED